MQFSADIEWIGAKRITTGWSDGIYRPLEHVTREAMAAFLYRLAGSPAYSAPSKSPFRDVSRSRQFYKEICWLASRKISTGWPDGTFRPDQFINRDAMAAFIYRTKGSPAFGAPARASFRDVRRSTQFYLEIEWMRATGISTGWPDGSYRPLQPITRDAMAAFLRRAAQL